MTQTGIALIGCGNMGRSLAVGLVRAGWAPQRIIGIDPDPAQRERVARESGIRTDGDAVGAVAGADVVILAVKPQMMRDTVVGIAIPLARNKPLLISIAAGIPLAALERWADVSLPIVRAMPNTPALIGTGATGLCAGRGVSAAQRELATRVLGAVGIVQWVATEEQLDLVTALSGSGPAYFFLLMEGLTRAAVARGLPAEQARALVLQTALGAARMAQEAGADPARLRQQVTSPGGTTERALQVLVEGGVHDLLARALDAAARRAAELARETGDG